MVACASSCSDHQSEISVSDILSQLMANLLRIFCVIKVKKKIEQECFLHIFICVLGI